MDFNINGYVLVRLTDQGRKIERENHDRLFAGLRGEFPYIPHAEDPEGWSKWQMWELMHEFGADIYLGSNAPFETTIRIPSPKD